MTDVLGQEIWPGAYVAVQPTLRATLSELIVGRYQGYRGNHIIIELLVRGGSTRTTKYVDHGLQHGKSRRVIAITQEQYETCTNRR